MKWFTALRPETTYTRPPCPLGDVKMCVRILGWQLITPRTQLGRSLSFCFVFQNIAYNTVTTERQLRQSSSVSLTCTVLAPQTKSLLASGRLWDNTAFLATWKPDRWSSLGSYNSPRVANTRQVKQDGWFMLQPAESLHSSQPHFTTRCNVWAITSACSAVLLSAVLKYFSRVMYLKLLSGTLTFKSTQPR